MENYIQLKKKILQDPQIKKKYDALKPEYKLIKEVIKKRLEKGMTQTELAKKIGTKQSAIARFESGNSNPSLLFLQKIANALQSNLIVSIQ